MKRKQPATTSASAATCIDITNTDEQPYRKVTRITLTPECEASTSTSTNTNATIMVCTIQQILLQKQ
jgi:hypothetical protein